MTISQINLDPITTPGLVHAETSKLTRASADMASRCLLYNRQNHIFTSDMEDWGVLLHNHVVYHVLSLWALGADPDTILQHAKRNMTYTLVPPKFADAKTVESLSTLEGFAAAIGNEDLYQDLVCFFEQELAAHGRDEVLDRYLLGDNDIARNILPRLFHGYVHAIMHVGLGIEFHQDTILAEGLAEAVVHDEWWYTKYLGDCAAVAADKAAQNLPSLSLVECYDLCLQDETVTTCIKTSLRHLMDQYEPPSKKWPEGRWKVSTEPWRDCVQARAGDALASIAGRFRVNETDDLEMAAAEVINATLWLVLAAQRPPHEFRLDFFLIHASNASLWLSVYLALPHVSRAKKAQLIQMTGHIMLYMAAGVGCPEPHLEHTLEHDPKVAGGSDWEEIFAQACEQRDDGHMIKFIRALKHGENVSKPYDHVDAFRLKQAMFLIGANATMDSVSEKPMDFIKHHDIIRMVGVPQVWARVPVRKGPTSGKANGTKTE